MSNLDKAVEVLREAYREKSMSPVHACDIMADALEAAGLLAPDLPEPEPYGELAQFGDEEVMAARGTNKVRIYIDDSRMSSESARELALMLLAAADHAEKEQDNGAN